ncbi:Chromosome partition protein Smc [uncultured Alphaproteobacteria bacterium]|uniref:Chromosome partition protein Smc n=1 Tax=uncultured Alphaproteobacteria bacterium TaxID=91750 RepID=A0A212JV09_9PROT|nr:Chromosome partition protein Smc [uncultured Alphaproteobacteria bacterium]
MIQFTKLRLSGFKSFVEPTELLVEPGLTGVVGPNGCGKSNLVEAMRWVMGETSAKQMRGGEMDDVIFAGSRERPPRNLAEVTLTLDNRARLAPAALNTADELEVTRRIERGGGSTYRVNGKEVRARDVQLLFADAATGARSTAIVSQGKISELIAAAPAQRRALLEEAAGISGLYSRRHEAELRLRAAENNLARLDDVLGALATQKQGLDRQARQAAKYRTLSDEIRALEIALTRRTWEDAAAALGEARARFAEADAAVTAATAAAAEAATLQADAFSAVDPARERAGEAQQALQKLVSERDAIDQEERRLERATRGNAERLEQIAGDLARAEAQIADAEGRRAAVSAERDRLAAEAADAPAALARAAERANAADAERAAADAALATATTRLAEAEAAAKAAQRRRAEADAALARVAARIAQVERQIAEAESRRVPPERLAAAEAALAAAEADVETRAGARDAAEAARAAAETARSDAAARFAEADAALRRIDAEIDALRAVLAAGQKPGGAPVLDRVRAEPGFEAAAAALLDHGADAPEDDGASPRGWRTYPPLANAPPAPAGLPGLAPHVDAPPALARRLALACIAPDAATADRLAPTLAPGQTLISRDGGLWRWDGYVIRPGAPSAAATRLEQANRLRALEADRPARAEAQAAAARDRDAARDAAQRAEADERAARDAARAAEAAVATARGARDRLSRERAEAEDRRAAFAETHAALCTERAEADAARAAIGAEAEAAPESLREALALARKEADAARGRAFDARAAESALAREDRLRADRIAQLAAEAEDWLRRGKAALDHRATLATRRAEAEAERDSLRARPQALGERRSEVLNALAAAEGTQRRAADALAVAESAARAADARLKETERAAAAAREDRVRAEAAVERREQAGREVAQRCRDQLGCGVDDLAPAAELAEAATADLEARAERRAAERERLGPVNLRAEIEADDVGKQIAGLTSERDDLLAAIARLRQGIAALNREGRERLQASFETVNRAFQEIFTRLFGGGRAHLSLIEGDDPLAAGLEIMASPPGKRLQLLSLLSGGEQALTALALLFAVFHSNPAPICILDEVDAPLDDANVDRFCGLIGEIAGAGRTRFLVITHHRMTMARMNRLFGVTMAERGVSQLVSVDLGVAETLRESPLLV